MATVQLQLRRGVAAEWTQANPVLADGEIGIERDTRKFKIGNGASHWADLAYGGLQGSVGGAGEAGPQGAQGPIGQPGPAGSAGPAGATGSPGPAGLKGDQGNAGPQGPAGAQGPKGDPGTAGATGPQGQQGVQGVKGDTGTAGSQGIQGLTGDTGAQGAKGDTGSQGTQGAQGVQGSPGNNAPSYGALSNGATAMAFATAATRKVTPTALATYTTTVPAAGTECYLIILTSGTNSYTLTFGTGFKPTGTLATGTSSGKVFVIHFISDGVNLYEAGRTAAMTA